MGLELGHGCFWVLKTMRFPLKQFYEPPKQINGAQMYFIIRLVDAYLLWRQHIGQGGPVEHTATCSNILILNASKRITKENNWKSSTVCLKILLFLFSLDDNLGCCRNTFAASNQIGPRTGKISWRGWNHPFNVWMIPVHWGKFIIFHRVFFLISWNNSSLWGWKLSSRIKGAFVYLWLTCWATHRRKVLHHNWATTSASKIAISTSGGYLLTTWPPLLTRNLLQ